MLKRYLIPKIEDPVWIKVFSLAATLFFIFLSDAILSFWVPNFLEVTYQNQTKVGLIMSFSSSVGLIMDLLLPQVIKGITVRKLAIFGIITSGLFSLNMFAAIYIPFLVIVLLGMGIWGVYYELLGFAQQQFVADATPTRLHPAAWGILGVFKSMAYTLGPLLAGLFIDINLWFPLAAAIIFALVSFIIINLYRSRHDRPLEIDSTQVNFWRELDHWKVLSIRIWPVIILSILLGLIDAFFWTIGPLWSEELSKDHNIGRLLVSIYVFPSLFMGFLVAKWGIYKGKKKLSEVFFLVSSLFLMMLGFRDNIYWLLSMVLLSSLFLAVAYPLIDGVYSDIIARMGVQRRHMMGISNSTFSLAYIIGPIVAGISAGFLGLRLAFCAVGFICLLASIFLLSYTPKKLKLPQNEISQWPKPS